MIDDEGIFDSITVKVKALFITCIAVGIFLVLVLLALVFKLKGLSDSIKVLRENTAAIMSDIDPDVQSEQEFICFPIQSGVEKDMVDTSFTPPPEM